MAAMEKSLEQLRKEAFRALWLLLFYIFSTALLLYCSSTALCLVQVKDAYRNSLAAPGSDGSEEPRQTGKPANRHGKLLMSWDPSPITAPGGDPEAEAAAQDEPGTRFLC